MRIISERQLSRYHDRIAALMAFLFKKVMILATALPVGPCRKGFYPASRCLGHRRPRGLEGLLKVIISAVILAILGIMFIMYNQHDGTMVSFGWSLVAVGALIGGVFTFLAFKARREETEPEPVSKGNRKRRG